MHTSTGDRTEYVNCHNCYKTTGRIPLTLDDIFRISDFIGMDPDTFFKEYCEEKNTDLDSVVKPFIRETYNGCPFIEDGLCSINFVKPHACKMKSSITDAGRIGFSGSSHEKKLAQRAYMASMMLTMIYYSKQRTFDYNLAKPFVYRILLYNQNRDYVYKMFVNTIMIRN